ncbi:MAG: hypothetical protein AAF799_47415 [Myxococcota bacterium]
MSTDDRVPAHWRRASRDLGFTVVADHPVTLGDGQSLTANLYLPQFGAPRGMLVVYRFDDIEDHVTRLGDDGFGFSTLEPPSDDEPYDRESFEDMLRDWGWSADPATRPAWLDAP